MPNYPPNDPYADLHSEAPDPLLDRLIHDLNLLYTGPNPPAELRAAIDQLARQSVESPKRTAVTHHRVQLHAPPRPREDASEPALHTRRSSESGFHSSRPWFRQTAEMAVGLLVLVLVVGLLIATMGSRTSPNTSTPVPALVISQGDQNVGALPVG